MWECVGNGTDLKGAGYVGGWSESRLEDGLGERIGAGIGDGYSDLSLKI